MRPEAGSKRALREVVSARRDAMPREVRAALSGDIVRGVLSLPAYRDAGTVLAYAGFGSELETDSLLRHTLRAGKVLLLPRIDRRGRKLDLYEVGDPDIDLEPGLWGIREPRADPVTQAEPGAVDFALVPGLAFDRRGRRLGYGGGFYDRLISGGLSSAYLVSGAFEVQMVDKVPADRHDMPVDVVVTEKRVYVAQSPSGGPG